MLGLLPLRMLLSNPEAVADDPARYRAEAELVDVLESMPPWPRGVIQRGLLRANCVLVGAYVASQHRACPLASAVWETTGSEPDSMYAVKLGLAEVGLTHDQMRRFVEAFDGYDAVVVPSASCAGS